MKVQNYYRGRCVGRMISFLKVYCNVIVAHEAIFNMSEKEITFRDKLFATYEWEPYSDVPIFTFYGETKDHLERIQEERKHEVLRWDLPIPETQRDFERLAKEDPDSFKKILEFEFLHPALLTFAAEAAKHLESGYCNPLDKLLRHESPLVREGAVYGCEGHLTDWNTDFIIVMRVKKMAEEDPSPGVREAAQELIAECDCIPF